MKNLSVIIKQQWLGRISYGDALNIQNEAVIDRRNGKIEDTVFLLEHEPVYTIGRTRDRSSLPNNEDELPHPLFETNRGGQATYHGPGQLIGYPVINLDSYKKDLHRYLRCLENALVSACAETGVEAEARQGLTGVWCGNRKIASIGVGVRHWISMHGFAVNVSGDLSPFEKITPCGIADAEITSINRESGKNISVKQFSRNAFNSLQRELFELANAE